MAQNASTVAAESAGHAKVFPPLDPSTFAPQLVWLAIAFGLLYVLFNRVILPRVGKVIEQRGDRIKGDLALAEKLNAEIQSALTNYEKTLADARAKASIIAKAIHSEVATEIDKERARAEADIAAKLTDAERRISEAKAKALTSVNDIAAEVAQAIVARLIGKEVSKDDVDRALMRHAANRHSNNTRASGGCAPDRHGRFLHRMPRAPVHTAQPCGDVNLHALSVPGNANGPDRAVGPYRRSCIRLAAELAKIGEALAATGLPSAKEAARAYFARNGEPYSAKSVRAMLSQQLPARPCAWRANECCTQ